MARWYGSLENRLMENHDVTDEIKVGTGMTEYSWSDRHAYEVIEVKDQKHVVVRMLRHRAVGEAMSNEWELYSDESAPTYRMEKRGDYWYYVNTLTAQDVEQADDLTKLRMALAGFDLERIAEKGSQTKRTRANVSFGKANYYYDYEF